jgi:1-acyl-sn-glycerol-3-phosphate acyltransferase
LIDKIRSPIYNFLFYVVLTPGICIIMMPALLFRREATRWVAHTYQLLNYYLERYVLNLKWEVRGLEYLPKDHAQYIVASKHHSAYETMKLMLLFKDPTIILKRELLSIPIFGWFLNKLEVIAIDRSNRGQSLTSLSDGAKKMKENSRPIVIFPQGTRVSVDATTLEKPYKGGVLKLYTATNLPIIPLAMNSGLYWPRNAFWKKSGTVIFEFLPPIPSGTPTTEILQRLEHVIETASDKLVDEGRAELARK